MKKNYLLLTLLSALVITGCNKNENSSKISNNGTSNSSTSLNVSSTTNDNSSSTISSSTNSSSSSSSSSSSVDKFINVLNKDLECTLTEDGTGFIIYKYKKWESYIRLPETFTGVFLKTDTNKNVDVYSGDIEEATETITLPIVGIMDGAFRSSGGVEDIYIPDCYVNFSHSAFYSCTTIKNYIVSENHSLYQSIDGVLYSKDGESLFAYPLGRKDIYSVVDGTKNILRGSFETSNVVEVVLPESVENIEAYAFSTAKRLEKINIPSKVKVINESTFDTCNSLKTIDFSEGLETIGYRAFWQCRVLTNVEYPLSLKEIGESAFEGNRKQKNIVFNEGLTYIGKFAFAYCEYIESIEFSSTIKTIDNYAFIQTYSLKELRFNEGLEVLGEGAFYYNTGLCDVYIPSTLHTIGYDCFTSSDSNLKQFIVEDSDYFKAVDKVLYTKDGKELVCFPAEIDLTEYTVLEGTEKINDHAFYNCLTLKSLTLPSSLTKIGKAPFYMCKNLKTLTYLGTVEDFEKIEKSIERFTSTEGDYLEVYWNDTYYSSITQVECSNGTYNV